MPSAMEIDALPADRAILAFSCDPMDRALRNLEFLGQDLDRALRNALSAATELGHFPRDLVPEFRF
jgi:hypothetical protein